jgi:hypothetical protein
MCRGAAVVLVGSAVGGGTGIRTHWGEEVSGEGVSTSGGGQGPKRRRAGGAYGRDRPGARAAAQRRGAGPTAGGGAAGRRAPGAASAAPRRQNAQRGPACVFTISGTASGPAAPSISAATARPAAATASGPPRTSNSSSSGGGRGGGAGGQGGGDGFGEARRGPEAALWGQARIHLRGAGGGLSLRGRAEGRARRAAALGACSRSRRRTVD